MLACNCKGPCGQVMASVMQKLPDCSKGLQGQIDADRKRASHSLWVGTVRSRGSTWISSSPQAMRSFTKQNMRRFAGSNYIIYREGSLSAVAKQQRSAGQLPDVLQLHLLKLAHLLPQILFLQHREQPRINRREICRTGNQGARPAAALHERPSRRGSPLESSKATYAPWRGLASGWAAAESHRFHLALVSVAVERAPG